MGKALVIAEKPSVASDIARALGGCERKQDYFEGAHYVICSAVGHLLEICAPEGVEVKRGKWTFANLPVIPPYFDLKPIEKVRSRLKLIARLVKRKDVETLINACDAGREGELIFRYIVQHTGSKKPIKRLWLQSMTPNAIREGFRGLRSDEALQPLASAAVCRSESDWLVGINGTRAMTAFNSKTGGFYLTTVGRVQTPTLTILVEREEAIKRFVPRDYWEVHATFHAEAGTYEGRWFDETFSRHKKQEDGAKRAERIWQQKTAEAIRDKCAERIGTVTEESKPSRQQAPLLYDLTSLQREANGRFGFSAVRTLQLAQALYERHKVITYPRTDSRALPEDYLTVARETLSAFENSRYEPFAKEVLDRQWVRANRRVFNNAKISDHFAIIPTATGRKKNLRDDEERLYDLITRRFIAVFYPAAEFLVTTRITRVMAEAFKTDGKVMVSPGWLAVYGKTGASGDQSHLTRVKSGESVRTGEIEIEPHQTKPPPRFSEATLLSAMEGAGKLVDDEELRAAMSAKGLGTPATRAATIDGLIKEKYLVRDGRELQPTAKAFSLITLLRGLNIPELCSPELTGDWEYQLKQMERGELHREEFMTKIQEMTRGIVEKAKRYESDTVPGDFGALATPCPKCGGVIKETYKTFKCQGCDFALWKTVSGRQFEPDEMEVLLAKGTVGPLQGFRSKTGRPFAAVIRLTDQFKPEFDFGHDTPHGGTQEDTIDFSGQEPLGSCPRCGASVYESAMNYVCQKSVGPEKSCDFRSGRVILQRVIERGQVAKLLRDGRTDLLDRFVSRKTGRAFNAFLVLGEDGKVGFEFEKRESRGGRARSKPTSSKTAGSVKIDFSGQEPVGTCPLCRGRVYESEKDYLCEHAQREEKSCAFRSGKTILQQPISREQMVKLLADRKTDVMDKFISKRGYPFAAALTLADNGKVGFEFPDRKAPSTVA